MKINFNLFLPIYAAMISTIALFWSIFVYKKSKKRIIKIECFVLNGMFNDLTVRITNIGFTDVYLEGIPLLIRRTDRFIFNQTQYQKIDNDLCFPIKISPGEPLSFSPKTNKDIAGYLAD
jgi:hypothetical protein